MSVLLEIDRPQTKTQVKTKAATIWIVALSAMGVLLLGLQSFDYINFAVDDVFITLRVAQNAAEGHGLVYNVGEFVEGYSNFLWTLMITGLAALFNSADRDPYFLMWLAKGLSYISGLATMFFLYRFTLDRTRSRIFALFSVLALIGTGPFVLWMMGGLEGTFYALLLTSAIYVLERYRQSEDTRLFVIFGVILFLASITRPEVLMHSIAMMAIILISIEKQDRKYVVINAVIPYAVLMAGFFAWRWFTYNDILPNTFYAKTGGGMTSYVLGLKYLLAGLIFIAGPFLLAIPLTIGKKISTDITIRTIIVLIASTGFFVSYSSGDWMAGFRFIMPLAPLLIALGIESIHALTASLLDLRNTKQLASIAFCTLILLSGMIFAARQMIRGSVQTMPTGFSTITGHCVGWHEEIGNWFKENTDGKRTIATGEAGMIAYLNPEMRVIDLYGLLDKYIAHRKKNRQPMSADYLYDQKPDYILLYGTGAASTIVSYSHNSSDYPSVIATSPRFTQEYQLKKHFISLDLFERKPGM